MSILSGSIAVKLGIVLGIICSIILILCAIKLYFNQRSEKAHRRNMQRSFDLKARAFEESDAQSMEEGSLFGIRAPEAGYTGGIPQATPLQSASSSSGAALLGAQPGVRPFESFPTTRNSAISVSTMRNDTIMPSSSRTTSMHSRSQSEKTASHISSRNLQNAGGEDNLTDCRYSKGELDTTVRPPRLYAPPYIADSSRATLLPPRKASRTRKRKSKSMTLKPRDYEVIVPCPLLSPRAAFEASLAQEEQLITYRGATRITSQAGSLMSSSDEVHGGPLDHQAALANFVFDTKAKELSSPKNTSLRSRRASTGSTVSILVAFSENPFDDSHALLTARSMLSTPRSELVPSPLTLNRYTRKLSQASTIVAADEMSKLSMYESSSPYGTQKLSQTYLTPDSNATTFLAPESPTTSQRRPSSSITLAAESPISSLMSAVACAHYLDNFPNITSSVRKSSLFGRKPSTAKLAPRKSTSSARKSTASIARSLKPRAPSAYTHRSSSAAYSISDYYETAGHDDDHYLMYYPEEAKVVMSPVNEESASTWLSLDEDDELDLSPIAELPKAMIAR